MNNEQQNAGKRRILGTTLTLLLLVTVECLDTMLMSSLVA